VQEIKMQKEQAALKRKKQELLFLGRIQRCYHKEREEKETKKKEDEDLVA